MRKTWHIRNQSVRMVSPGQVVAFAVSHSDVAVEGNRFVRVPLVATFQGCKLLNDGELARSKQFHQLSQEEAARLQNKLGSQKIYAWMFDGVAAVTPNLLIPYRGAQAVYSTVYHA